MHSQFVRSFTTRYPIIKSQYPGEGRRRWHLRVMQEFWQDILLNNEQSASRQPSISVDTENDFDEDDDPMDHLLEGHELGVLLRTDYTNEDAWKAFCTKLQNAEQELADGLKKPEAANDTTEAAPPSSAQTEESDSDEESSDVPFPIIKIINPSSEEMPIFQNMSNLTALRLLNDVDIRPAPNPPAGESRIKPPNRLIDQGTWQEIYSGMNIWIYDAQSNNDQCVRLVSQEGDIYGTATGDSWRVQGSHICELQFNMSYLGMTINFGGLDRWDYSERRRNLDEAKQTIDVVMS